MKNWILISAIVIFFILPAESKEEQKKSAQRIIPYTNAVYMCRKKYPEIKDEKLKDCVKDLREGKISPPEISKEELQK